MKAMMIKDIMLGDWVYILNFPEVGKKTPVKIVGIDTNHNAVEYVHNGIRLWSAVVRLEPIPITPEILEKNGFEERDDLVTCDAEFQPYVIDRIGTEENYEIIVEWRDSFDNGAADGFNRESWCESWNFCCRSSISNFVFSNRQKIYVHQLQNALRLCGIKKEITI